MAVTKVFRNGNSQAVRIPADLAFDRSDMEVEITRDGDTLRIRPLPRRLEGVMAKFAAFSDDFMDEGRDTQTEGTRDTL
jgi:antitoxin VapB